MASTLMEDQIVETVRRYGNGNTDAILNPRTQFFSVPYLNGFIGYRVDLNCAVVFGDPVTKEEEKGPLANAFHEYAKEKGFRVIYISASESFTQWFYSNISPRKITFGKNLYLNPANDPRDWTGSHGCLVRRKEKHAIKEGIEVHEYLQSNPEIEKQLDSVAKKWLNGRKGAQIHISDVDLFTNKLGKRWFYATHHGKYVGVAVLNKLESYQGWLLNHVMFTEEAPGGTPEILVLTALDAAKKEGYSYVTFGGATNDKLESIVGFGTFSTWLAKIAYTFIVKKFHLDNRYKFWEKFHPETENLYLLFSEDNITLKDIAALLRILK